MTQSEPIADTVRRYWPSAWGAPFCRLFGWIGHDWVEVVVGASGGDIIAGQQCRRCYRTRDCACRVCQLHNGRDNGHMTDLEQRVHDALLARWDEWGHEGQDVDIALIAAIAVEAIRGAQSDGPDGA